MKLIKKKFKIYWLDGKTEIIKGCDIVDAFTRAGYGAGAINAVDYYDEVNGGGKEK